MRVSVCGEIIVKFDFLSKTQVNYLRCNTLDFSIKFKYMIVLINETQIIFTFPKIIKFNTDI